MSQEEPSFKSLRITLSEEALRRLDQVMKEAAFRSSSSTVEECIRVVYEIMRDLKAQEEFSRKRGGEFSDEEMRDTFLRLTARMARFTGSIALTTPKANIKPRPKPKQKSNSAGGR